MKKKIILWITWIVIALSDPVASAITINVAGSIPPSDGQFVNGTHAATIGIYSGTSGTPVWSEDIAQVSFQNGLFNLILGTVNNDLEIINLDIPNPHLGITIPSISSTPQFIKLTSTPYAFKASIAETARIVPANTITGTMINPAILTKGLTVSTLNQNSLVVKKNQVGIGTSLPNHALDVNGTINSDGFSIQGIDITGALSWKPNSTITSNIYYTSGRVGVGISAPRYHLDVVGTVNASGFSKVFKSLSAILDWQRSPVASENLYFINLDGKVGIGVENPRSRLHVLNEIRVSTNAEPEISGMIRRSLTNEIEGRLEDRWTSLTGFRGTGKAGKISHFTSPKTISYSNLLNRDFNTSFIGIGKVSPNATLDLLQTTPITTLVAITSTQNQPIFTIGSTGNIGIKTSTPNFKLKVAGDLNADEININGLSILLAISKGSVWLRNQDTSIYYNLGNVGIGQNRPGSLLEIAQRTNHPNEDPAITISKGSNISYTFGVKASNPDTFLVEFSSALGSQAPLFAAKNQSLGIGVYSPQAPLHVSGNLGVILSGPFFGVAQETEPELVLETGEPILPILPMEGPGTRLIWQPQRAVFRAGSVASFSPMQGQEWDNINSGKFSTAFGFNTVASGNFTTIAGGRLNIASGAYSTVLGGENNIAEGDFSVAAGRNAIAFHDGSFVFGDSSITPTSTITDSQFLIFATRGVGLGTNDTSIGGFRTGLVVKKDTSEGNIFQMIGHPTSNSIVTLSTSGNMVIGSTTSSNAQLAIFGGVRIGGIPRDPSGNIHTESISLGVNNDTSLDYVAFIQTDEGIVTPGLVVTKGRGHVGMAIVPNMFTTDDINTGLQIGTGSVLATGYVQPDGTSLGEDPIVVWATNTPNIYYTTGNVGIGSPSPNSLLELSNVGGRLFSNPQDPKISFNDSTSIYSIGVRETGNNALRFINGNNLTTATPKFSLKDNFIGIQTATPLATLHVAGGTIINTALAIGTTNVSQAELTTPKISAEGFNIKGRVVTSSGSEWNSSGTIVFKSLLDQVGIGTSAPTVDLHVIGDVSANSVVINNEFRVQDYTQLNRLDFIEDDTFFRLQVATNKLYLDDIAISDVLSRGLASSESVGPLTIWIKDPSRDENNILSETDFIWHAETPDRIGLLKASRNINIVDITTDNNTTYQSSTNIQIGTQNILTGFNASADLTHNGSLAHSKSYTLKNAHLIIGEEWTTPSTANVGLSNHVFDVIGTKIKLTNKDNEAGPTSITSQAKLSGIYIDVTDVNTQTTGEPGYKYSAIFMGDVGVGLMPRPSPLSDYILDVNGTVSANSFIISNRLSVTTLNANDSLTILDTDKVGIGISTPHTELEVVSEIKASHTKSQVIQGQSLSVNTNSLIASQGRVGMGTIQPESLLHIHKTFTRSPSSPYKGLLISTLIESAEKSAKGLEIKLETAPNNSFGNISSPRTATALNINLSGVAGDPNSQIIGIQSKTAPTNTSISTLLLGGNVGIGVTTPTHSLHVSGTIRADQLLQIDLLTQQEAASFNYLQILSTSNSAYIGGQTIANNVYARSMRQSSRTFVVNNQILLPTITLFVTGNEGLLTAQTIITSENFLSKDFTVQTLSSINVAQLQSMSIGPILTQTDQVQIESTASVKDLIPTRNLISLSKASFNTNALVIPNYGFTGIGTTQPQYKLDVRLNTDPYMVLQNPVNIAKTTAGIIFTPGSGTSLRTAGSGIVAVKPTINVTASELVFITDPNSGNPVERMRLPMEGGLRIGRENRATPNTDQLVVLGNALISGITTINNSVVTNLIQNTSNIRISGSIKIFDQDFISSQNMLTRTAEIQELSAHPVTTNQKSLLYSVTSNNGVFYATVLPDGSLTRGDLEESFTGDSGSIPAFDADHILGDSNLLSWTTGNINSAPYGKFSIHSNLNSSQATNASKYHQASVTNSIQTSVTLQKNTLTFRNRNTGGIRTFAGYQFQTTGGVSRLADGEKLIGLDIDMTTLASESRRFSENSPILKGNKYAAIIRGGFVGVGTTPQASLHVAETTSINAFFVESLQTSGTGNALIVKSNGSVGIGLSSPNAKLALQAPLSGPTLKFQGVTENISFLIAQDGKIGVNELIPSYDIHITGQLKAKKVTANILYGKTMDISNQSLVVNSSSYVGVNNPTPVAQLDLIKTLSTSSATSNYTLQKFTLLTNGTTVKNIEGISYIYTASSKNIIGSAQQNRTLLGASFNLSSLNAANSSSKIIGVTSIVSGNNSIAAVFNGGLVGIGITEPSATLDIIGSIRNTGNFTLNLTSKTTATEVTVNTLSAQNVRLGDMTVTPNKHIVVQGTLTGASFIKQFPFLNRTPTANPEFLLAQSVTTNRLRIATNNLSTIPMIIAGTSIFTGGQVGIRDTNTPFNASANLHVYAKGAQVTPFAMFQGANPVLRMDYNGNLASFLTVPVDALNPTSNVFLQSNSGTPLQITNAIGNILKVSDTGTVAIGTPLQTQPSILYIKQLNTDTDILTIASKNDPFSVHITNTGLVGISSQTPESQLHVSGSMKINHNNTVLFHITSTGNVGFGLLTTSNFTLKTQEGMQLRSSTITGGTDIPTQVTDQLSNGILQRMGSKHLFFGLIPDPDRANQYNTHIQASSSDTNTFIFRNVNTEIMRLINTTLAIGTTVPSSNLHILKTDNSSSRILTMGTLSAPNVLVMSSTGEIGIGSTRTSADIDVNGFVNGLKFQNHPDGTTFTAPTINLLSIQKPASQSTLTLEKTTSLNILHTLQKILINIGHDHTGGATGIDFAITGNSTFLTSSATQNAYGIKVDMTGLSLLDPTFQKRNSERYAATFIGGNVGIGTLTPDDALLSVLLTSSNATILSTGPVATFQSTPNIIPGGQNDPQSQLQFVINTSYNIPTAQRFAVPTDSFKAIAYKLDAGQFFNSGRTFYATDAIASDLMSTLRANNVLTTKNTVHQAITSMTDLMTTLDTIDINGYITPYITTRDVATILQSFLVESSITFRTKDLDAPNLSYTPITLISGTKALIPKTTQTTEEQIQEEAYKFAGRVLINAGPEAGKAIDNNGPDAFGNRMPALIISGNMRVGIKQSKSTLDSTGVGSKLFFSGGHLITEDVEDGDNKDTMYIARRNIDIDSSELRFSTGENHTLNNASLKIGFTQKNTHIWETSFVAKTFSNSLNSQTSMVGIGTNTPVTTLHINGSATFNMSPDVPTASSDIITANVAHRAMVLFENTTENAHTLLIKHSAEAANGVVGSNSNFISFKSSVSKTSPLVHLGSIEGNGDLGIQFTSPEADYAEYLPKLNPNEVILPGQIVGVFSGKVTKTTTGADQLMVTSVAPIIAGNWKGDSTTSILVAFLGQVPIKVQGPVSLGDYIIPSGKNDGLGIAISKDDLTKDTIDLIIGRAWQHKNTEAPSPITTSIGLNKEIASTTTSKKVTLLSKEIEILETSISQLERTQKDILEKRKAQIAQLNALLKRK